MWQNSERPIDELMFYFSTCLERFGNRHDISRKPRENNDLYLHRGIGDVKFGTDISYSVAFNSSRSYLSRKYSGVYIKSLSSHRLRRDREWKHAVGGGEGGGRTSG